MIRAAVYSLILCSAFFWGSSFAFADGYGRVGGMYTFKESGTDDLTKTSRTLIDIGAGYVWQKGWTLGGLYQIDKTETGNSTLDHTSYGPTAGWISRDGGGGPYVLGTYFFSSKRSDNRSGNGYQFDLGYRFPVKSIFFAVQMSYKHFSYDKLNDKTTDPAYVENFLDPYLAFMVDF